MGPLTSVKYDHVQMYVDDLQDVEAYKKMEAHFGAFCKELKDSGDTSVKNGLELYGSKFKDPSVLTDVPPASYASANLDLAQQMICGLGWAVTGSHTGNGTYSVLLNSPDANGARFILTTKSTKEPPAKKANEGYDHFSAAHIDRFLASQAGRPGCAVLCFQVAEGVGVGTISKNLQAKHPKLQVGEVHEYTQEGGSFKVLEMFAYYSAKAPGEPDQGTVLRFIERAGTYSDTVLPGLSKLDAQFSAFAEPAYSDHWVSNVSDRKSFLQVLDDVLGFTPKVDFNAGVVAAGEAIIESTVSGNTTKFAPQTTADALVDQSQVFLPINNTLAPVGHVHLYLEEIGQGIQHLASRVSDLVAFIQQANDMRDMTGETLSKERKGTGFRK